MVLDVNRLLKEQAGYVRGMPTDPNMQALMSRQSGFVKGLGTVPMSPEFTSTLSQMLKTGAPVDTAGAEGAARSESQRMFDELSTGINERMTMMGKTGSSAQTGMLSRAGGEISTRLGEIIAKLRQSSMEAAEGRRMGALSEALGFGGLQQGAKQAQAGAGQAQIGAGLDLGRLGLAGKSAQAGAGMDLLNFLKGGPGSGTYRAAPAGVPTGTQYSRPPDVRKGPSGGKPRPKDPMDYMKQLMASKPKMPTEGIRTSGPAFGLGQQRLNKYKTELDDWQEKIRSFAALMGHTGPMEAQSAAESQMASTWMGAGAAATGANQPMLQESARQDFMKQMIEKYGPGFAGQ